MFMILSLALGIGANAIYSFMDAILPRSLPVEPSSLVVMTWHSKRFARKKPATIAVRDAFWRQSRRGRAWRSNLLPAFERLREVSGPVLSSIFVRFASN